MSGNAAMTTDERERLKALKRGFTLIDPAGTRHAPPVTASVPPKALPLCCCSCACAIGSCSSGRGVRPSRAHQARSHSGTQVQRQPVRAARRSAARVANRLR